jgi:hypothetical protein
MNSAQAKTKKTKLNQFIKFISNVTSINSDTTKQIKEKPQINHGSVVGV